MTDDEWRNRNNVLVRCLIEGSFINYLNSLFVASLRLPANFRFVKDATSKDATPTVPVVRMNIYLPKMWRDSVETAK